MLQNARGVMLGGERRCVGELHLSAVRNARGVMFGGESRCMRELHLSVAQNARGVMHGGKSRRARAASVGGAQRAGAGRRYFPTAARRRVGQALWTQAITGADAGKTARRRSERHRGDVSGNKAGAGKPASAVPSLGHRQAIKRRGQAAPEEHRQAGERAVPAEHRQASERRAKPPGRTSASRRAPRQASRHIDKPPSAAGTWLRGACPHCGGIYFFFFGLAASSSA